MLHKRALSMCAFIGRVCVCVSLHAPRSCLPGSVETFWKVACRDAVKCNRPVFALPGSSTRNSPGNIMSLSSCVRGIELLPAFAYTLTFGLLHHLHPDHRELLEEHSLRDCETY